MFVKSCSHEAVWARVGCSKSYSAALRHFKAVEEVEPGKVPEMVIKRLEVLEAISGVELQREADIRNRR